MNLIVDYIFLTNNINICDVWNLMERVGLFGETASMSKVYLQAAKQPPT